MKYFYTTNRAYARDVVYKDAVLGMTAPEREAFLFRKYLEDIPIYIEEKDLFAGWYGYPEGEEPQEILEFSRNYPNILMTNYPADHPRWTLDREFVFNANGFDRSHDLMDCRQILQRGLNSYVKEVELQLEKAKPDSEKAVYLKAMKQALEASRIFSERYADLAAKMAADAQDEAEKQRLLRIEKVCRKVPMEPAEDFYEAIQALYFLYSLNCISDDGWVSVSFGSFDQYVYPYYLKSKEQGWTDAQMQELLVQLFYMLDIYEGQDCALCIGGIDDDGNDLTNDLSYLVVSAEKASRRRAPLLAVRINPKTPAKLMDALVDSSLFEIGQPTFYSENECFEAVKGRGFTTEKAKTYQVSTCMQLVFPGENVMASWGINTNMHLPLELALNNGKPFRGEFPLPFQTEPKSSYNNVDEICEQYTRYSKELFAWVKEYCLKDLELRRQEPNPWLSAVGHDCIELGCDRYCGGSKYLDIIVQQFAFANAADALGAVEKLVFEEKKYTIDELVTAAIHNFEGYEQIRKDILSCPKYGQNNVKADEKARRLLGIMTDICEENWEGDTRYLSSLHTLNADVDRGAKLPAMLDGRLAGEPVNKNAGPANEARNNGPTAIVMSATRIDQKRLSGGQALDVHFAARNMDNPDKKAKIGALIKTYLANGGMQMQVNALSPETLKKAYAEPDKYRNLIVRIGGHSRYFYELSDSVKLEFIERFSKEEAGSSMA
ncbi:MAG: hypothetical protein IKC46_11610 [Lachnospiraceae bacterium]|nr:hypothetical protein [Lachnospiraceae bacterium]